MIKIAVYGKGGIGKSTVTGNLAAAFASLGKRVIQIGCDPKADSTINLLGGEPVMPVMNYLREHDDEPESIEEISKEGYGGVLCIETGGPTPGLGCAGRGIITTFSLLEDLKLFEKSVAVAAFRTEHSGVSSTAGRSHKKHNRIWHCKSCSFYTKSLRSR